jgi:pimeloyl-ACP methyl ester carboxylesterase
VAGSLWLDLLGSETRYYDAGGIRTRSIQAGSGDALILLHGIGATAETFARNVMPLSAHFDTRAIDLLGHGLTGTIAGALSKDAFVEHVVDYMDAAGIERAHLIGVSLGGWLAMWTALLHPARIGKVVNVVGAHLNVPVDESDRQQAQAGLERLQRLTRQFVNEPTRENLRARLGYVFHHPERDLPEELVDLRSALHRLSTNAKQVEAFVGNPGPENLLTPEVLATVSQPTLLLWTDHNPSTAAVAAKTAVTYLPKGEFALMTDCGHWPQWEDPATFDRIVTAFLTR